MSLGAANITNVSAVLKKIWPQDSMQDMFYDEAPLLAMLPKDTSWSGTSREILVQYGQGGGRSTNFARAKANKNPTKVSKMSVETADNFCLWSVDHKFITLSRNDKGAIVRALESQTKSSMKKFKRSLCWMIYGNGGGSIGQVSTATTLSSTTLKFRSASSFRKVDIDDVLTFASDDGVDNGGARTGSVLVTAVDPEALTVTVTPALNVGVSGITTADYVFIDGDYNNVLKGVEAYVPATAPTSTIWGMARTPNKRRLGGIRVGGKGLLIQEAVKKALKVAKDEQASTSHIFMNTQQFLDLELSLGSSKRYCDEKVGSVGFTGIEFVNGGSKPVKVFPDADCDENVIRGFQMDTWTLASAGEYPDFLNINGNRYEQEEASNSFEGRIGGYAQLYTDAPGLNWRLDLTSA